MYETTKLSFMKILQTFTYQWIWSNTAFSHFIDWYWGVAVTVPRKGSKIHLHHVLVGTEKCFGQMHKATSYKTSIVVICA